MKSCLINISFHFVDIQICHFQTGLDHLTVYAMGRRKRMFGNVTGTYSGEWSGGGSWTLSAKILCHVPSLMITKLKHNSAFQVAHGGLHNHPNVTDSSVPFVSSALASKGSTR